MDAIHLIISRFTGELVWLLGASLFALGAFYTYAFVIRRSRWPDKEWVPSAIVKEYLDSQRNSEQQIRYQLFGEMSQSGGAVAPVMAGATQTVTVQDPNLVKELEALKAQLQTADSRTEDLNKSIEDLKAKNDALTKEKEDLAKASSEGGGGADVAAQAELQKKVDELQARLDEYEVIEDDLANLKKYQIENKELKEKLAGAGLGESVKSEEAAPSAGEEPVATTEPASDEPESKPEPEQPKLAEVETTAEEAEAPKEASDSGGDAPQENNGGADDQEAKKENSGNKEEELLSEFEKMLAS